MEFDKEIDTSGLSCPLPVIKAKKALKAMEIGQILKVISTDPGSKKDIPAWARMTGQDVLGDEEDGKLFTFFVKRSK